jgi:hypothetical protein
VGRNPNYKAEVLDLVENRIRNFYETKDIPVMGSLKGTMFAEDDCFDTPFHLIHDAVERRTHQLANDFLRVSLSK